MTRRGQIGHHSSRNILKYRLAVVLNFCLNWRQDRLGDCPHAVLGIAPPPHVRSMIEKIACGGGGLTCA